MEDEAKYVVERNGQNIDITLPSGFLNRLADGKKGEFIQEGLPFEVKEVPSDGDAFKAGLKSGDKIVNINGSRLFFKSC